MFQVPSTCPEFSDIIVKCQETGKQYIAKGINVLNAPSWMEQGTFVVELRMETSEFAQDIEWQMTNLTNPCPRIDVYLMDGAVEACRFRHCSVESRAGNLVTLIADSYLQSSGISEYDQFMIDKKGVDLLKEEKAKREREKARMEAKRREAIAASERKKPYLRRFRHAMEG
jgi:hypothetical protein